MITGLDHLVLTVADIARCTAFYRDILGLEVRVSPHGRVSLHFGSQKINLHEAGHEISPHAAKPCSGSADLCFVSKRPLGEVMARLAERGVPVELGPVEREGALGSMRSVYLRDPDQNLIEIAVYT